MRERAATLNMGTGKGQCGKRQGGLTIFGGRTGPDLPRRVHLGRQKAGHRPYAALWRTADGSARVGNMKVMDQQIASITAEPARQPVIPAN